MQHIVGEHAILESSREAFPQAFLSNGGTVTESTSTPVDIRDLQQHFAQQQQTAGITRLGAQADPVTEYISVRDQLAECNQLVRQFVMKHHLSTTATNELLSMIAFLTQSERVSTAQSLPSTAASLWRENVHGYMTDTSQLRKDVCSCVLEVDNGNIKENFHYFSMGAVLAELLAEVRQPDQFFLRFEHRTDETTNERIYGDINTAEWWRNNDDHSTSETNILSIILYIDGISVDFFGNVQLVPIMATLGNFRHEFRQSLAGKRLVGFVPHMDEASIKRRTRTAASTVRRQILHASVTRYETVFIVGHRLG